jgi:uncharacterized protein YjeT (DUF2065 family)
MADLLVALGLVLVIEGLVFAGFPGGARRALTAMQEMSEANLRVAGLISALVGVVIVWAVRG